ncbi:hypothetical protein BCAR13_280018 [Paraburkholderia caribensis]|nr:hypothetical protein BCAR13_280018 [Paraburkholderia caribensis]
MVTTPRGSWPGALPRFARRPLAKPGQSPVCLAFEQPSASFMDKDLDTSSVSRHPFYFHPRKLALNRRHIPVISLFSC